MLLAGLHLVPSSKFVPLPPAFDFMEQQLLWRCVADLMLSARRLWYAAPQMQLVGTHDTAAAAAEQPAASMLERLGRRLGLRASHDEGAPSAVGDSTDRASTCAFCGASPPHTPQIAPCGHGCCYFCVASARMASTWARCPRCAVRLT